MSGQRGQALAEFSLAITLFLAILLALFDFGMAVYKYNGVAQAAREIARVTSVHPGTDFTTNVGRSAQTLATIRTQAAMIPGLTVASIACVDGQSNPVTSECLPGDWVSVRMTSIYRPVNPILGLFGTWTLAGVSTIQIQSGGQP